MRIGLDLGGTKIEGVALGDDGAQLARRRVATPRHDYAATLEAMAGLVRDLEAETGRRGSVGVGMPGALSPATGLVKNANSTWLIGQPLDRDLSGLLGRPVRFANDANCFALSEAVDGAAAGARVVFGVIVGTGTGGGVVVDRKVLTGPNAIAGEWGHNPLPWPREGEWPGPACYCGKTGCVETFLSGPGPGPRLPAGHRARTSPRRRSWPARSAGTRRPRPRSSATRSGWPGRSRSSSTSSTRTWSCSAAACRRSPASTRRVPRLWQEWAFSDRVDTVLRPPVHGDSSGVRGAAWLWGPGEA